uniref:Putative secreted protein n=1 Tax=Ixodes ricinus TaxID=34613 RepID=A0A6B0TWQ6_IXORI
MLAHFKGMMLPPGMSVSLLSASTHGNDWSSGSSLRDNLMAVLSATCSWMLNEQPSGLSCSTESDVLTLRQMARAAASTSSR